MANVPNTHEGHNLSPDELIAVFIEGELEQAQQHWDNENANIVRLLLEIEALEAVKRKSEIALCGHQMLIDLYQDERNKIQKKLCESTQQANLVEPRINPPYLPGNLR